MNGSELKQKFDEAVEYANSSSYPILVSSSYGKISPNGIVNCKKSDTVNLLFTADSDYQFIRWRVVDKSTGHEIENQDYISFDDENDTNTSFTLKKINPQMSYVVEPYCEIRPAIVSASPLYDSDGVYRDRRIIVMFDQNMSESSIYYDLDEQDELTAKGYTLLKDGNRGDKCYGYWDGVDKSSICFKNILISKRKNQAETLLAHYEPPYFDESDSSVLRIDAKQGNDAPPEATDILVTIVQQMGSKIDDDTISLANHYRWSYYTNGKVDNDSPTFNSSGESKFTVLFDGNRKIVDNDITNFKTKDSEIYIANNLKNQKLFVQGGFYDGGSGPKSLKWKLYKIDSPYYPEKGDTEKPKQEGQVSDLSIVGGNAEIKSKDAKGSLVSLNLTEDDEGLYKIDFICSDKNDRESKQSYYFVHDITPPKLVDKNTIKNERPSATNETITWEDPDSPDFGKIFIEQYKDGVKKAGYEVAKGSKKRQFTGMSKGKYQYKFYSEDMYGNRTKIEDTIEWQDDIKPAKPSKVYIGAIGKKRIRINYTVPACEEYDYLIISGAASKTIENGIQGTEYYFEDKTTGTSYKNTYYLQSVDFAGNVSDSVAITPKPTDVKNGMICYKSKTDNNIENLFFCFDYISDMIPLGVVCDNSDVSKVRIWDLTEATGYCWGRNDDPCSNEVLKDTWNGYRNTASGLEWYNYIKNNKSVHINYQNGSKNNCHTIWYYLENEKNKNSPVTWYIPGVTEFNSIIDNYSAMQESYTLLETNRHSATLFTEQKPYWTGCPRYKKPYANAVMLNKTNDGIYDNIATNGSLNLYLSGENKEDSWYYKDEWQCEKSGNRAALITHAMAQIDMK